MEAKVDYGRDPIFELDKYVPTKASKNTSKRNSGTSKLRAFSLSVR
jgi:hypothetical protein